MPLLINQLLMMPKLGKLNISNSQLSINMITLPKKDLSVN